MNLYLIVFLLLAVAALAEWKWPEHEKKLYSVCWAVLTALLCLRFGQGTDYISYHGIYLTIPTAIDLSQGYICGFYPETGWRLLNALFKLFHAPFQVFAMVLGLAEMLLLHRFLKKYVPRKVAGLFLSYPVLFFVYMVSGLRQGLAICIFLGIALPFYLEKKWIPYVVTILVAASFHKVGYAWLVLVIAAYVPMQWMMVLTGLAAVGGVILQIGAVERFLVGLLPIYHVNQFLMEGTVSLFAVGERLLSFLVLAALYFYMVHRKEQIEERPRRELNLIIKAYLCGVCFYMLMFGNSYYASRYGAVFKVLECAAAIGLIGLIGTKDRVARAGALFFFCLTLFMGVKNLNAAVREGGYDELGVHVLTYPYITVLHQDKINEYFDYSEELNDIYEKNIGDQELWMIGQ